MWWQDDPEERFWVEITRAEHTGKRLICPQVDERGRPNWAYDLVTQVVPGDVIYHWSVREGRFLGRSVADRSFFLNGDGWREVPLRDFEPVEDVGTEEIREQEPVLRATKADLQALFPGAALYLPFQYSPRQPLRFMSNYFAKLPACDVRSLFDPSGTAPATPEPSAEVAPAPPLGPAVNRRGYLQPFKAKSEERYRVLICGGPREQSPAHEALVNSCAQWLADTFGYEPGRNQAIDLGVSDPAIIIEAKTVGRSWAIPIRAAVGQLYEYRYWQLVPPDSTLIFLADRQVPAEWIAYLEQDRNIGCLWPSGDGQFDGSAAALLALRPLS